MTFTKPTQAPSEDEIKLSRAVVEYIFLDSACDAYKQELHEIETLLEQKTEFEGYVQNKMAKAIALNIQQSFESIWKGLVEKNLRLFNVKADDGSIVRVNDLKGKQKKKALRNIRRLIKVERLDGTMRHYPRVREVLDIINKLGMSQNLKEIVIEKCSKLFVKHFMANANQIIVYDDNCLNVLRRDFEEQLFDERYSIRHEMFHKQP
jgi:hypothetical protein